MATKKSTKTIAAEPSAQPALIDSPTNGEFASADLPTHCAFINDKGVYMGLVEYPVVGEETPQHLLNINECDLPVGEYVWDGSCFHPIKARNTHNALAIDSIDAGVKLLQKHDYVIPLEVLIWLKQLKDSVV